MNIVKNRSFRPKRKNDQLIDLLKDDQSARLGKNHADSNLPVMQSTPGNPAFVAQFDINVILQFYTVAAGVYTLTTQAAVVAAQPTLNQKLPVFLFGNSDFGSGYAKLRQQFPVNVWAYDSPFIFGAGLQGTVFGPLDANIRAQLQPGDMVQPLTATIAGTNYLAIVIVRSNQVGYGSLLQATNSDMFQINLIRYTVPDQTAVNLAQYLNKIQTMRLSLFGKNENDSTQPNAYKVPEQQQSNIIDVPIKGNIDKEGAIATYINNNVASFEFNCFVAQVLKVN